MEIFYSLMLSALVMTSCNTNEKPDKATNSNPFFEKSKLDYQAPDFTKIKDDDFKPAIEEGMKQQLAEMQKITDDPAVPTFKNTFIPMEKSGALLYRVNNVFDLLTSANTNPTLQNVQEEMAPKLAAHEDAIYLNPKLFERVKSIYSNLDKENLDKESKKLVEYYYQKFVMAGANLTDSAKDSLKLLNGEIATLSAKFTNKLLAASKAGALVVANKEELAGFSDTELKAAATSAKDAKQEGKWLITLQNTTQQAALQSLTNRATRQKLLEASINRAEKNDDNDTRATISRMAQLRAQRAKLLGFDNYAAWNLQDQMAKTPAVVQSFLGKLVPAATQKAKNEASEIQTLINKQKGGFQVQAWDWNFYAEQVRKAKYDLDENEIKPYFELDKVLKNGVFYAATKLYGITFKERTDLPVYQDDVKVFELFNEDGSSIGLFYCDYFKRDNKSGGAWMSNIVGQSTLLGQKPVIYNVCNFTKPAKGEPALISFDDVTTMFHEFGHALHGFFASQKYPSLSGTDVARDFVEFPSQFNEHWAMDPSILKNYAVHYKTGQQMPQTLVDKIKKSSTFNQGYALTELLAAASLDMEWHTIADKENIKNVDDFESASLKKTGLAIPAIPPRYRSSYFLHIWGNGYASSYYAYLWTEMLDDDAYTWFEENGGLTRANGQRFRNMILSKGNTEDYNTMFMDFRGHAPNINPMLKNRGLIAP